MAGAPLGKRHPFNHAERRIKSADSGSGIAVKGRAEMMDFLGLFRRRPAKRGKQGFGRPRAAGDITDMDESLEELLSGPVRDAPPIAREAPVAGYDAPRPSEPTQNVRQPQQDRPRQRRFCAFAR